VADQHPAWCARGHRCAQGEHRSAPVTIEGDITYTLVSAGRGVWVEYRGALLLEYGPEQAAALGAALAIAVRAVRSRRPDLLDGLAAIATPR
jgi:hypothetical protein